MSDVQYRAADARDLGAIVEFQRRMARETEDIELDLPTVTAGVEAVLRDPALGRYFVAEVDGAAAGSLMITFEWSDWRNGMVWWIQSVYVPVEHRRRGIYGGLYNFVKRMVEADASIRGIRLYVDRRNVVAQQVYGALGMDGEHYRVFEWMKQ